MSPVAIVDTNVVVAGLLTKDSASPVARILDAMLSGLFPFVVSEPLLTEYRLVLLRPKIRALHGLSAADVESILTDLAHAAIPLKSVASPPAPDHGDQLLWDLLAVREDLVLVTGDKRLLDDESMRGRILSPKSFCDLDAM